MEPRSKRGKNFDVPGDPDDGWTGVVQRTAAFSGELTVEASTNADTGCHSIIER